MTIILTNHAKARLAERLSSRKDKWQRIAEKAFLSELDCPSLHRIKTRRIPRDSFDGEPEYKFFMGLVFVFARKEDKDILVTVINPREFPV